MKTHKYPGFKLRRAGKRVSLRRSIAAILFFTLLQFPLAICCAAEDLKPRTSEAFDRYVRITDAQAEADLRRGVPFLWVDSLPPARRQQLGTELQQGHLEIRQVRTEEEGNAIEIPDGLIHHWSGVAFVPGVSIERILSLLQDYENYGRMDSPDIRRSKLLDHTNDAFKVYLQFYKDFPQRVSFNAIFQIRPTRIDGTHAILHAVSVRIAELEHPEQPESKEVAVGQGSGYLWRLNYDLRLEAKDGGVYMQMETISLSRDVPATLAWFINPLIRHVSRQTLANFLYATQRASSAAQGQLFPNVPKLENGEKTAQEETQLIQ
jgi:hypothetical protein